MTVGTPANSGLLTEPRKINTGKLIAEQAIQYAHDLKRSVSREREKQETIDRMRKTFFSAVKHEMHTPLALIFQMLEVLEDPRFGPVSEVHLDALTAIRRQSQLLGEMVEGLTSLAAYLSKRQEIRPVLTNFQTVLDDVLPLAEFKARTKDIIIDVEIEPNLPLFPVDIKQMAEVLTQLLGNAIKFSHSGDVIKLSVSTDDNWVIIKVRDQGPGIDPGKLEKIWEIFEQGTDAYLRSQEGLGMGLAIVRNIIDAHQGQISVESSPGEGSVFTLRLPKQ
ncbi:MAG: HAMP domain-containing sensor histidine kinase [Anaerolineae bacterium]|nr:HAMP domain-containing sensor histidine kinase [Anaerolineae bacterium]